MRGVEGMFGSAIGVLGPVYSVNKSRRNNNNYTMKKWIDTITVRVKPWKEVSMYLSLLPLSSGHDIPGYLR